MIGISHTINLIDSEPTAEQTAVYMVLARTLRDMKYEHIIFDFQSYESPGESTGLIFLQMCRDGDQMHVEVRIDCPELKMYASTMDENDAVDLLREAIHTREAPDVSGWKDITDEIGKGQTVNNI